MRPIVACALLLASLAACTNMTPSEQAALSAGTVGAAGGLVIGALAGGALAGAAIGAAAGATYGALRQGA
jgi:osmotically inducible lipoprotein OsmB